MDAKTRTVLIRAGTTLTLASAIVVVALVVNAPSTVRVDFDVACRRFVLPAAATLDLNRWPTQISSGEFYGFDGLIIGGGLAVSNTEDPVAPKPIPLRDRRYPVIPSTVTPTPYLKVTPDGALGRAGAALDAGVELSASEDGALTAKTSAARAIRVWLQSKLAEFKAERYPVRSLRAEANMPGVETTLNALALSGGSRARLDVMFAGRPREVALLDRAVPLAFGTGSLTFSAARVAGVSVDGRALSSLQRDREFDLTVPGDSGEITDVSLLLTQADPHAPRLRIVGWVRTNSVRQGGAELLPTLVEEALDTSGLGRSLSITVLALLAFGLFKAVNSALDALLKLYIGD